MTLVGRVLEEDEPLPAGAIDFATNALAWRDVDGELAELLHDSAVEQLTEVRDTTAVRLMMFEAGGVTIDVEHEEGRLIGSVFPAGDYLVELQRAPSPAGSVEATFTETNPLGMFELDGAVDGKVRLIVSDRDGPRRIVSPWITLA
jgi:hypothetical protein